MATGDGKADTFRPIDMSAELSQLRRLTAMAHELSSGIDRGGMAISASAELDDLNALLAAMRAFAAQAFDDSVHGGGDHALPSPSPDDDWHRGRPGGHAARLD